MNRNGWLGLGAAVVLVGGGTAFFLRGSKDEVKWRSAKVDKGNIISRISATGTVNALIQVPVGTQVSGVVTGLFADFNSLVKKGQIVGKIDETPWLNALHDAEAQLQRAEAALANAKADYKRNKRLWEEKLLADADLDVKDLALKTAQANVDSAKATVARANTDLGYCTLKAPVDGVVVARLVDVGQTVAASFSTPNVFTIAQNLSKMKVQAAIDEADIGQVKVGLRAFFTVDSYPDKQFRGVVSEVQLNPVVNQNVVTYNVIMEVDNESRYATAAPAGRGGEGRHGQGAPSGQPGAEARPAGWQRGAEARMGQPGAEARPGGWQRGAEARGGQPGEAHPGGWQRGQGQPGVGAAGMAGQGRGGRPGAMGGAAATAPGQTADIELNTARYIPAGSPVYKGELALFPGMTANCTIVTKEVQQVMRVPSAALRFNPAAFLKDQDNKPAQGPGQGGGARQGGSGAGRGLVAKREDRVWILVNGKPKALPVKAGATDGMFTEITGEGVTEGMAVLTGVEDLKKLNAGAAPIAGPGGPGGMRR